ncbi:MAG: hypothetical protein DCE90_19605 [Pseudanabaena sp.]|nr:MAG: hypothetical protein DCE90_19605 [Pseudanabaena sp.]
MQIDMKFTTNQYLLVAAIAGITAFGFASPTKAQYRDINCAADIKAEPNSRVNMRSEPTTNSEVLWTFGNGTPVIILNDRPDAVGASPLRQQDRAGNDWYMVTRFIRGRAERQLTAGLVPKSERGWIRADFLNISCPP